MLKKFTKKIIIFNILIIILFAQSYGGNGDDDLCPDGSQPLLVPKIKFLN